MPYMQRERQAGGNGMPSCVYRQGNMGNDKTGGTLGKRAVTCGWRSNEAEQIVRRSGGVCFLRKELLEK